MPLGLQAFGLGDNLGTQKRKLQRFQDFIEQKFSKGHEYQIGSDTLEGIISVTIEVSDKIHQLKGDTSDLEETNFELRNRCSAALSLYQQPMYREFYIETLNAILPALDALISLL